MADSTSTLLMRVVSAVFGGLILLSSFYFYGPTGLLFFSSIMIALGIREFSRMAFVFWKMPDMLTVAYGAISFFGFVAMFRWQSHDAEIFAVTCAIFLVACLWLTRGKVSNENLLAAVALGIFGLIYCVLFPLYALRIIYMDDGAKWFLFLLLVVFFGDTFAYFSGRWFGREKFMPMIPPNKTWAGSAGGLIGSVVAGVSCVAALMPGVSLWQTALFCLSCGVAAQTGDLLMSLVKRVAHVKDTGTIMPGHGGILDRLDGVFIACPLVHAFALYVMA